jgi:hypothetical protein
VRALFDMHTFLKVTAVLIFGVAGIAAAIGWGFGDPLLRMLATPVAIVALGGFFVLHFRRDIAPDFLREQYKGYLERNGFCFCMSISTEQGVAFLNIPFQNRFAMPSVVQFALRQKSMHFMVPAQSPFLNVEIQCGPGAFGIAHFPVGIPLEFQGKKLRFEAGVSVNYPDGKGKMLRFRSGMQVPYNAQFSDLLWMLKNMTSFFLLHHTDLGPYLTTNLPSAVAETPPEDKEPHTEVLWTLPGDGFGQR